MTPRQPRLGVERGSWPVAAPDSPAQAREAKPVGSLGDAACAAVDGAGGDVLACPAWLLGSMPVGVTLHCESARGARFVVTTSRQGYSQARADGWPAFVGGELSAMAAAAQHDRAYPGELGEWLARKAGDPSWRLTLGDALGGWQPPGQVDAAGFVTIECVRPWTIGEVFGRLSVQLLKVQMEG